MLITTSRRPGHRARLLGRELARVLPDAEYVPRGVKSVRNLASLASTRGHKLVTLINCRADRPQELRFLDVTRGWRWLDVVIELREVKLQKDLGHKVQLTDVKIVASGSSRAKDLARLLSEMWHLQLLEEVPSAGSVVMVTQNEELRIQFQSDPKVPPIGPIMYVTRFSG